MLNRLRTNKARALEELRGLGVIGKGYEECAPLDESKREQLIALGRGGVPEVVVKLARPVDPLWAAVRYLEAYRDSPLVPRLRYVDPGCAFLAYDFVSGTDPRESDVRVDKARALETLVGELLCRYESAGSADACWVDELHPADTDTSYRGRTWQEYIEMYLWHRHAAVRPHLPKGAEALVLELAASPRRRGEGPLALVHGDCGGHNFVFREGVLAGVIDPRPVAGEPVWDLAMAFVSWPGDLTLETVMPAAEALERAGRWSPAAGAREEVLIEEVLIAMYAWIGIVAKHMPEELPEYVAAWGRWEELLQRA